MGHARALLAVSSFQGQITLARQIIKEGWSVRQTERAVKRFSRPSNENSEEKARLAKDPDIQRLETDLGEKLGANVRIQHGPSGGRMTISYHSLEELEGIIDHLARRS
jgi:ParB family chromosome partitioning protein